MTKGTRQPLISQLVHGPFGSPRHDPVEGEEPFRLTCAHFTGVIGELPHQFSDHLFGGYLRRLPIDNYDRAHKGRKYLKDPDSDTFELGAEGLGEGS